MSMLPVKQSQERNSVRLCQNAMCLVGKFKFLICKQASCFSINPNFGFTFICPSTHNYQCKHMLLNITICFGRNNHPQLYLNLSHSLTHVIGLINIKLTIKSSAFKVVAVLYCKMIETIKMV